MTIAAAVVVTPWRMSPAAAMVPVQEAIGYPGDRVTVVVRNEVSSPPYAPWRITAPLGASIVSASGAVPDDALPFECPGDAAVGTRGGVSEIVGSESATFRVTVLAPPAPALSAPADGLRTLETRPVVSGTKRPGNAVRVLADGAAACEVPPDAAATWSCVPSTPLSFGQHVLSAVQTSPAGDASPSSAPRSVEILQPASLTITAAGPAGATPTTPVTTTFAFANTGPGTAEDLTIGADLGLFPALSCTIDGNPVSCGALRDGVPVAELPPGQRHVLVVSGAIPAGSAEGTAFPFRAFSSSVNDAASPVTVQTTLIARAPAPPLFTAPADGGVLQRAPALVSGTALPFARVTVSIAGDVLCTASASAAGSWSCAPTRTFPFGDIQLQAVQEQGGLTSAPARLSFRIAPPDPFVPPVDTPAPPALASVADLSSAEPVAAAVSPAPPAPFVPPVVPARPAPAAAPVRALPLSLRLAAAELTPGTVSTMRGTIGPNTTDEPVSVTVAGSTVKGVTYRSAELGPAGDCTVSGQSFQCAADLAPEAEAELQVRLYIDPLNAPSTVRQQITLGSDLPGQRNAMTTTAAVKAPPDAAAAELLRLDMSSFPGAFVPLLGMLLFAVAAVAADRRRGSPPR